MIVSFSYFVSLVIVTVFLSFLAKECRPSCSKGRLMGLVSAILFRVQFSGSRPDKITHPDVQRGDSSHESFSGNRNHKDYESGDDHLHCFRSGGQPHQIRQDRHQQKSPASRLKTMDEKPIRKAINHWISVTATTAGNSRIFAISLRTNIFATPL